MFTGIVTAIGTVREIRPDTKGLTLTIEMPYRGVVLGESIAVDGVCLTVEGKGRGWCSFRVVRTSLGRTGFGRYASGRKVNLERALRAGEPLGGHLVQGHVDGIGTVQQIRGGQQGRLLDLRIPGPVAEVTIPRGSITVDGVSLTVNAIRGESIQISLIPFTFQHTTLGDRVVGDQVHVEGDTIGKYVKGLLAQRKA